MFLKLVNGKGRGSVPVVSMATTEDIQTMLAAEQKDLSQFFPHDNVLNVIQAPGLNFILIELDGEAEEIKKTWSETFGKIWGGVAWPFDRIGFGLERVWSSLPSITIRIRKGGDVSHIS